MKKLVSNLNKYLSAALITVVKEIADKKKANKKIQALVHGLHTPTIFMPYVAHATSTPNVNKQYSFSQYSS